MGQQEFKDEYDRISGEVLNDGLRAHLGASEVGQRCARQAWYSFRHIAEEPVGGRMRRLWNRGHDEEFNFVRWLREMGVEVRDYSERLMYHEGSDSYVCIPWDDGDDRAWAECDDVSHDPLHIKRATALGQGPRQWSFTVDLGQFIDQPMFDKFGNPAEQERSHYCGSCDAKLLGVDKWFPEVAGLGAGLGEFKTHNDKSFKSLEAKGVKASKPIHWHQMQQYMHHLGLKWALYLAVNKNDDDIYPEIVMYDGATAQRVRERAGDIINMQSPPAPMTTDPSWFECKFCTFHAQCHKGAPPVKKGCRSCSFAVPMPKGEWKCALYDRNIPKDFIPKGCENWESIL